MVAGDRTDTAPPGRSSSRGRTYGIAAVVSVVAGATVFTVFPEQLDVALGYLSTGVARLVVFWRL
jgi:hypothetical protein